MHRTFQVNLAPAQQDFSAYRTFAFRVALRCYQRICTQLPKDNGEMDFTASLVFAGGASKEIRVAPRVRVSRPIGPSFYDENNPNRYLHGTLYTVEIPLEDFGVADLAAITGVRFTFDRKNAGLVDLSDLTLSKRRTATPPADAVAEAAPAAAAASAPALPPAPSAEQDGNTLRVVSAAPAAPGARGEASVDIVLTSKRAFPVTGAFPRLEVGDKTVTGGDISPDGKTMTIRVPKSEYDDLPKDSRASLIVQASSPVWKFGALPN